MPAIKRAPDQTAEWAWPVYEYASGVLPPVALRHMIVKATEWLLALIEKRGDRVLTCEVLPRYPAVGYLAPEPYTDDDGEGIEFAPHAVWMVRATSRPRRDP